MTERCLRRVLYACAVTYALDVTACTQLPAAPRLAPAAVGSATPTITRVAVQLAPDEREMFFEGAIRDENGEWRRPGLGGTLNPLYGFVYDEASDRFVVPGFHAVDRSGVVTFGTQPPSRPPVSVRLTTDELASGWFGSRGYPPLAKEECHIQAVWYGIESITLLCAPLWPVKSNPHERPRPLRFSVKYLDPRVRTNRLLREVTLPLRHDWYDERKGWDPRSTLARFLVDGSVVAEIDTTLHGRRGGGTFGRTLPIHGALRATVRIDSNGNTKVLHRGGLDSAHVTAEGKVVGVRARRHRQVLLGVDADGKGMFRRAFSSFGPDAQVGGYANGACILSTPPGSAAGSKTIACFDLEAELRWQRSIPMASEWAVDDAGWVYAAWRNPSAAESERGHLSAIDPQGTTAWTINVLAPSELQLVRDDELCFFDGVKTPNSTKLAFTDRAPDPAEWDPGELVCIHPRHGVTEQR